MSNSNALARGLPSYLDLVTQGRGPGDLSGLIQGTVELDKFYSLQKRERIVTTATPAGGANGPWSFFANGGLVPNNEAWLLFHYSLRGVVALGTSVGIAPAVQLQQAAGYEAYQIGDFTSYNGTLATAVVSGVAFPSGLMLPPGAILGGLTINLSAATAFNLTGFADIVRIRV